MAELVVGPAVIALIQISDRIVGLCKHYIETVRDYPSDLRTILVEISFLKTTLEGLHTLALCSGTPPDQNQASHKLKDPIDQCLRLVLELEKLFPSDVLQSSNNTSKRQKLKTTFAQLAWPLKESKARKLLDLIRPLKETFTLELTSQSRQDIKEIKAQTSKTRDVVTENQRQEIYKWLQHTDPSSLYYKLRGDYEPETGHWVSRSPEWLDWIDSKYRCLWIHGIPGAGKSVLMSHLIGTIQGHCERLYADGCVCVYYFCFYGHNQDEGKPFLRWLINQLCRMKKLVSSSVLSMYNYGGEPSLVDLLKALEEILREFKTVYVVIDALDESLPRHDMLEVVRQIVKDARFRNLQLLASSREYADIEKTMEANSTPLSMDNEYVTADIRAYVHSSIRSNENFTRFPTELLTEIEDAVSKGAKGMFRWAVCQLDILQRLKCESGIVRKALANLPATLQETYDRVLLMLSEEDRLIVRCLLEWIRFYPELYGHGIPCQILIQVAERCTSKPNGFPLEYFYDEDTIKEMCGCLIKVSLGKVCSNLRFKVLQVDFAHYTVREYIDSGGLWRDSVASLATSESCLMQQPLQVIFEEVYRLDLTAAGLQEVASVDPSILLGAMFADFNISCTLSAILALLRDASNIAQQENLVHLVLGIFDPSSASFDSLCTMAKQMEDVLKWFSSSGIYGQFWKVVFMKGDSPKAMQLLYLLSWIECSLFTFPLIKRSVEMIGIRHLTQERLRFRTRSYTLDCFSEECVMDGSIVEAAAQGALGPLDPEECAFGQLLDLSRDNMDPSKVLRLYIGGGHFSLNKDVLKKLLECGADPKTRSQRVTSLQIAVSRRSFLGTRNLLMTGADSNEAGSNTESPWEEESIMSGYNHLFGASPLYICRNCKDHREGKRMDGSGGDIEALLVEYGAKSFLRPESALILSS